MSDVLRECQVCKKPAKYQCENCNDAFYCNDEHRKFVWKIHSRDCKPFKILESDIVGRYLIATKDIKEGDIILQEEPIIQGPLQLTPPVCLGCGNIIESENFVCCSKCGWPMCSKECEKNVNHIPECYFTMKRGEKVSITNFNIDHPMYAFITVLRCLYQKRFNQDVWKRLIKLESHCEERKDTEKYQYEKLHIANAIRNFFHLKDEYNEDEILKICGIITINGHEVPLTTPPQVAIFQLTSMLEHSCKANCYKTFTSEGQVAIIAGVSIKKGDHLSICYTDPMWTTFNRQTHLLETKFFSCKCERCSDVTEFGTYHSAIRCRKTNCKTGIVLPETFFNQNEQWICRECKNELPPQLVKNALDRIGEDLFAMEKGNISASKTFLEYYGNVLPPNHFYLTDVKLALSQIIGQGFKLGVQQVADNDLNLKIKLCREINELVEILAPAEKRLKGILLFELYLALMERNRRIGNSLDHPDFASVVTECRDILMEVLNCLKHEPDVLQEGQLYQEVKNNLEKLNILINCVQNTESI